ncbi:hypothetical protein JTE90_027692 [Oedothorax gibbosus]|uniref:Uncharacterized protein n=1 Tax=Oedothorax gibbosus TaxID=931172 RepID=A0AAV6TYT3_9ARAC|nr:hypothetical protein JTE90_027692 [Oedothorax gibbosus]
MQNKSSKPIMATLCESKVEILANSFDEFREKLRDHEIKTCTKYVCTKSPSSFKTDYQGSLDPLLTRGKIIHWHGAVPYFHFGKRTYSCHQGKDLNLRKKQKYAEQRDILVRNDQISVKRLNMIQSTKKLDCPVIINVTCMYRLSNDEIQKITKSNKMMTARRIKEKIYKNESLGGEFVYLFVLPELSDHKNHVFDAAVIEPVDPTIQNCSISYAFNLISHNACRMLPGFINTLKAGWCQNISVSIT